MGYRNGVDEVVPFCTELEASPSAPAVTDCTKSFVLPSKGFRDGEDLRTALFFGIILDKAGEIKLRDVDFTLEILLWDESQLLEATNIKTCQKKCPKVS